MYFLVDNFILNIFYVQVHRYTFTFTDITEKDNKECQARLLFETIEQPTSKNGILKGTVSQKLSPMLRYINR